MKKLILFVFLSMFSVSLFSQDYGTRTAIVDVATKVVRFGVALPDGSVVVEEDSCAMYQLTAKRASTDSMNTAFRKGEYCVIAGGSSLYQDLSYDATNGHVDISNGTNADIGSFNTANAEYGLVLGSSGETTKFLRGDNTWQTVITTEVDGSITNELQDLSWDGANGHIDISDGNNADVGAFATDATTYGFVPGSNSNTTYFLRGDATWAAALTSNETITLSGDVTGSGTTAITTTIANDAVEAVMLNDNIISGQTELTSGLALTDELMISDAGTIKRMDVSVLRTLVGLNRQLFSATAAQTAFAVTEFDLTDEYLVFVNGALNMGGHSRSTNTVNFTTGLAEDSEVLVLN